MPCCRGQNYDTLFNPKAAAKELRKYERKGPVGPTRRLLHALRSLGGDFESLLDIGGGVGVLQHEFALHGASIVAVDASVAYLDVIRNEARARGYSDRQTIVEGDFVDAGKGLEPTDVVTLDKVVCCYPDMPALVSSSAAKARRAYGIVILRDSWWVRLGATVANLLMRLMRWEFRAFVHPPQAIDAVLNTAGLRLRHNDPGVLWVVRVYERHSALS